MRKGNCIKEDLHASFGSKNLNMQKNFSCATHRNRYCNISDSNDLPSQGKQQSHSPSSVSARELIALNTPHVPFSSVIHIPSPTSSSFTSNVPSSIRLVI